MTANGRAERPRRSTSRAPAARTGNERESFAPAADHKGRENNNEDSDDRCRTHVPLQNLCGAKAVSASRPAPATVRPPPHASLSWNGHRVPTFTSLVRLETPDLIVTSDLRQLKCPATKATSSALAFPSTGGAFNWAYQIPSSRRVKDELRELGLTFTSRITADLSRRSNGEIEGPEDPPTIVRRHHQFPLGSET